MRIPEAAEAVHEGRFLSLYRWEVADYEGKAQNWEAVRRPEMAQAVAVSDGLLVWLEESQPAVGPYANLVGGYLEAGESPLEAARRELREETGLEAAAWEKLAVLEGIGNVCFRLTLFVARGCRPVGEARPEGGERIRMMACDFDAFLRVLARPDFRGVHAAKELLGRALLDRKGLRRALLGEGA